MIILVVDLSNLFCETIFLILWWLCDEWHLRWYIIKLTSTFSKCIIHSFARALKAHCLVMMVGFLQPKSTFCCRVPFNVPWTMAHCSNCVSVLCILQCQSIPISQQSWFQSNILMQFQSITEIKEQLFPSTIPQTIGQCKIELHHN